MNSTLQAEIVQMHFCQFQTHKVTSCKIPKASGRTYIFQRGFLVGLYSVPLMFERSKLCSKFSNLEIEKRIGQRVRSYYSYKLCLSQELRDTTLSYLSKDKEDKK